MGKGYKRRQYFTDRSYQGKFVLTTVAICALGMLLSVALFNYLSYEHIDTAIWRAHIDENTVAEIIRPHLIYSSVFSLTLTVLILVFFSKFVLFKTAPPLYRMKKYIENTSDGHLNIRLDWMENDEFKNTALELDRMVMTLREKFDLIKEKGEDVSVSTSVLPYLMDRPSAAIEKCRSLMSELDSLKQSIHKLKETG